MHVQKLVRTLAVLLVTLQATTLPYDYRQLPNAQNGLWLYSWRNDILSMPPSAHRELEIISG